MTQEIIEMAREAGWSYMEINMDKQRLEAFAKLVAEREREECAKVCAEIAEANKNTVILQGAANCCAASIRARGRA
jgi:uncharacterized radical SAM superfamily Fe-S cluster-containing enzyme